MPAQRLRYRERLSVPWWVWLLCLSAALLLAAEIHLGYQGVRSWMPYVVVVPTTAVLLWWLGRIRLVVTDTTLYIDDAHIPLDLIAAVTPLDSGSKRTALGRELHRLAFVINRPWVPTAARIEIADPNDPTPYWIISTRCPQALATIVAARQKLRA